MTMRYSDDLGGLYGNEPRPATLKVQTFTPRAGLWMPPQAPTKPAPKLTDLQRRAFDQGERARVSIERCLDLLPRLMRERQVYADGHADQLAPAGRSPQVLLDAEMGLLDLLPPENGAGKPLSEAAKDKEIRRLKAVDANYLRVKGECVAAAAALARLDNDVEIVKTELHSARALLAWATALATLED